MIPRFIHQIWLGPARPPEAWIEKWRDAGWEHRLWRESDLAELDLAQRAFDFYAEREQWYGAANVARVAILLKYGGLYVDVDSEPLRSLNDAPFLDEGFVVGYEPNVPDRPGRIANGTIFAEVGHPILVRYNQLLKRAKKLEPSWDTTGGTMLTRVVEEVGGALVLPPGAFYPEDPHGRPAPGDEVPWMRHFWSSTNESYPHQAKRIVILVPRRDDNGHRDRLWAWAKHRWKTILPDYPIYEGHHNDGPFNRSAAINTAARLADEDGEWDYAIVIDSDIFIRRAQVQKAIETARKTGRVTWAHRRWRGIEQNWAKKVIETNHDFGPDVDRDDMDILVERTTPISWSCCVVIPRKVWDGMGGFDERFRGWGWEDMAFQSVVCGLYGHERIEGDVYHLWHPRSEERIVHGRPATTATPEYIQNGRLGRRYMVALRRDHGLHDRPGLPSSIEENERDIANLMLEDAKGNNLALRHGLPDWTGWWPTLEELRDGWKQSVLGTVTVIVHTGGTPDHWEERTGYLRESLASLVKNVSGPITQRVLYSDWGDEKHDELVAIAREFGFYVAGEGHHGYTGSMRRMWGYLAKRGQADYVFQAEDDFTYDRPVDLVPMMQTLKDNAHLIQLALLRDPFYQDEKETGGILGWPEPAFTRIGTNGTSRLEHRLFFTANPSLFRKSLTSRPWPAGKHSETLFGQSLIADKRIRFAFWGEGEPWIRHIGQVRAGVGY